MFVSEVDDKERLPLPTGTSEHRSRLCQERRTQSLKHAENYANNSELKNRISNKKAVCL